MIKLNRWIPTKKNAAFKRINFWIYIKISTTTFVTAKIPTFSQGGQHTTKFFFLLHSYFFMYQTYHEFTKTVKNWIMKYLQISLLISGKFEIHRFD